MTNLRELFAAGGPVFVLLLLLSVYSWAVIFERWMRVRKMVSISRKLLAYCRHPLKAGNYPKIADACTKNLTKDTAAAHLILPLVKAKKTGRSVEEMKQISNGIIDWETTKLQGKLTILGTLGSITPFVGLFGTVIGVMHAFKDLASSSAQAAGGATVVAAGIAEALVNTAAGLFVAIPAVIAYNYFLTKTNYFAKELENGANEIIFSRTEI